MFDVVPVEHGSLCIFAYGFGNIAASAVILEGLAFGARPFGLHQWSKK